MPSYPQTKNNSVFNLSEMKTCVLFLEHSFERVTANAHTIDVRGGVHEGKIDPVLENQGHPPPLKKNRPHPPKKPGDPPPKFSLISIFIMDKTWMKSTS